MYTEYYNLDTLPFQLMPDPRFFFESEEHRRAMAHLSFGIHHAEGFIVITGEVGAGKTMLVDRLLSQIDPSSFIVAKIVTTLLGGDDLLRMVATAFGLTPDELSKAALLSRIEQFATSQITYHRRPLLIVDEAQNLSFEALEELRMLSNITVGRTLAFQSFLLGQPQFRATLGNPALDQLRQRVTTAYHLGPMNESDTRAYVEHRLTRAGWTGDPQFSDDCFAPIFQYTGGIPRRVNTLCSRLLLNGFLDGSHAISVADTERVANELVSELSTVTSSNEALPTSNKELLLGSLTHRISDLEDATTRHHRAIKRMVEILLEPVPTGDVHGS